VLHTNIYILLVLRIWPLFSAQRYWTELLQHYRENNGVFDSQTDPACEDNLLNGMLGAFRSFGSLHASNTLLLKGSKVPDWSRSQRTKDRDLEIPLAAENFVTGIC